MGRNAYFLHPAAEPVARAWHERWDSQSGEKLNSRFDLFFIHRASQPNSQPHQRSIEPFSLSDRLQDFNGEFIQEFQEAESRVKPSLFIKLEELFNNSCALRIE